MSTSTTITVRIPIEMKKRLELLAKSTDRSKAYLAAQAISDFLEVQGWQTRAIQEGLEAAERGEFASDEIVEAAFAKWGVMPEN